jgi:hypothetical protein
MTDSEQGGSSRAIGRLTVAVWVLVGTSLLNLAVSIFGTFYPPFMVQRITDALNASPQLGSREQGDRYSGFHDWPLEKQIAAASVIALTKHRAENGKIKSVIVELLKLKPGTAFYYKLGDEYGSEYNAKERTAYGDGQVMFFVGSPAQFRYSTTYSGDRILGLGDMPIALLRQKIQEQK